MKLSGVGDVIRSLREERGISIRDLAKSSGILKSTLSRYENNKVSLSLKAIEKIAKGLGVPAPMITMICLKKFYPILRDPKSNASKAMDQLLVVLG